LFWAGISSAFFWTRGFNFAFLGPWLLALGAGAWFAQSNSRAYKKSILTGLMFRNDVNLPVTDRYAFQNSERGILSSLGPVPFQYPALAHTQSYAFSDLQSHCPAELVNDEMLASILGRYLSPNGRSEYPAHVALFDSLARIFLHPTHIKLPAGLDRHGDRSLLSHSLLVCALMLHRARDYIYRTGSLSAIDPNYKLDPLDPLLPIIGLSHDLGKLRTFTFDETGRASGLLPGHGPHGSRNMSMIEEFWDARIDAEERRVLQAALAYYHHMSVIPVQKQKDEKNKNPTVTSDRLHAILGLLGECDRLASAIELGKPYEFKTTPEVFIPEPVTAEEVTENLFESFSLYLATTALINARGSFKSVAFKYHDAEVTGGRHLLFFDEKEFNSSFSQYLQKTDLNVRDGKSSPLTNAILKMLDENGYLYRAKEGAGHRSAINCLYKVEFWDEAKAQETPALHLSSAFVVDVTDWPKMEMLRDKPNCNSKPSIVGARFGAQGLRQRASAADDIASSAITGSAPKTIGNDLVDFVKNKKAKAPPNPTKVIQKIGNALAAKIITIAQETPVAFAIVGFDPFFVALGVVFNDYIELPPDIAAFGILKIQKSKTVLDQHVVLLDKTVFNSFIGKPTT
jgi:hypothetical protein